LLEAVGAKEEEKDPIVLAVLNAKNKSGNTALHWAALNGHVEVLLVLLQRGADPSILNTAGHDALFEAELNEKTKAAEVLLAEGKELESTVRGGAENDDEDAEEDVEIRVSMGDTRES
jgi:ankyrin repeat protein